MERKREHTVNHWTKVVWCGGGEGREEQTADEKK